MRAVLAAAGLLLAVQAPAVFACGYCVEDKIAATYDHAVVARALRQGHHVVFFHVDGPSSGGESARRAFIESSAASVAGVDKGSVRVSEDALTVSIAFDPAGTSLGRLQAALDRKLAARKLELMPLRVMDRPAELKTVRR